MPDPVLKRIFKLSCVTQVVFFSSSQKSLKPKLRGIKTIVEMEQQRGQFPHHM